MDRGIENSYVLTSVSAGAALEVEEAVAADGVVSVGGQTSPSAFGATS